jgi:hypothetical protein
MIVSIDDVKSESIEEDELEKSGKKPRPVEKANVLAKTFDQKKGERDVEQTVQGQKDAGCVTGRQIQLEQRRKERVRRSAFTRTRKRWGGRD